MTPETRRLVRGEAGYPAHLGSRLGASAPDALTLLGNPALLGRPLTGLFCSAVLPLELVLPALDLAQALRDCELPVVGGFHSPLERDCLDLMLRGRQPIIACLPRALRGYRLPPAWQVAAREGRLLLVGALPDRVRRADARGAQLRNRVAAGLATDLIVIHATPGGRIARLVREALDWGLTVRCPDHPANEEMLLLGAIPLQQRAIRR